MNNVNYDNVIVFVFRNVITCFFGDLGSIMALALMLLWFSLCSSFPYTC